MSVRLLVSCGEASGDLYAGALIRELRSLESGVSVAGLGGPHFAAAGGRLSAPQDKPWGMREFEVWDPSGCLLRIGQIAGPTIK